MHDAKSPEEIAEWHRWFGIECNNLAWKLASSTIRTAVETDEMLHAAHAAALHWNAIGTELNRTRAAMLLGHVHALVGDGVRATRYAQAAYDYVTSHKSDDWEIAFAHAILANAAAASGDAALHAKHYAVAERIGGTLSPEERPIFDEMFCTVPAPSKRLAV
jgi:urease accessory protein UreF